MEIGGADAVDQEPDPHLSVSGSVFNVSLLQTGLYDMVRTRAVSRGYF